MHNWTLRLPNDFPLTVLPAIEFSKSVAIETVSLSPPVANDTPQSSNTKGEGCEYVQRAPSPAVMESPTPITTEKLSNVLHR